MARPRWQFAHHNNWCRNCKTLIPPGYLQVGPFCLGCALPFKAASPEWLATYYTALTSAVRESEMLHPRRLRRRAGNAGSDADTDPDTVT